MKQIYKILIYCVPLALFCFFASTDYQAGFSAGQKSVEQLQSVEVMYGLHPCPYGALGNSGEGLGRECNPAPQPKLFTTLTQCDLATYKNNDKDGFVCLPLPPQPEIAATSTHEENLCSKGDYYDFKTGECLAPINKWSCLMSDFFPGKWTPATVTVTQYIPGNPKPYSDCKEIPPQKTYTCHSSIYKGTQITSDHGWAVVTQGDQTPADLPDKYSDCTETK